VSDKADQYQKPGGFSLATGRPPGDTAAGALSTGKLESRRGPPGGAGAGAISAGAIKLESKCGLLGHAAAGAPSAGAIIVTDSVKSAADCFPGVKRVAGGGVRDLVGRDPLC